jgi:hypothetical protein
MTGRRLSVFQSDSAADEKDDEDEESEQNPTLLYTTSRLSSTTSGLPMDLEAHMLCAAYTSLCLSTQYDHVDIFGGVLAMGLKARMLCYAAYIPLCLNTPYDYPDIIGGVEVIAWFSD